MKWKYPPILATLGVMVLAFQLPLQAVVVISNFESNVVTTDLLGAWTTAYTTSTSTVNSTDTAGNGISDYSSVSIRNLTGLTQLTLTASVAVTNPGSNFSIVLEDSTGKQASATFNWSSFSTSFTAVSATLTYDSGFNRSGVIGWNLLTGGIGDALNVQFKQLIATSASPVAATISFSNLTQAWDGNYKVPTVTTSPAGLNAFLTFNGSSTPPTQEGTYTVVAIINDGNYSGTATTNFTILPVSGNPRDIPTLPEWAMIFLTITVVAVGWNSLREQRA
jgi:hypothetical protein